MLLTVSGPSGWGTADSRHDKWQQHWRTTTPRPAVRQQLFFSVRLPVERGDQRVGLLYAVIGQVQVHRPGGG